MKKNRFISIVVTLTMLLSSLSGLTAITANAEGETDAPALADLKLMEKYTATFSSWTAGTDVLETYDTDNWTYTGRVGKNGNYIDVKAEKDGVASGVLTFNNTADSGAFYYKYSVRMTNTGARNTVSLCGVDDAVVLTSPMSDTSGYYAYTTVIDNETGKAYTYNSAGAVVNTVSFTGTVTGLKFASTANNLLISSFSYGKIVNVPELSSYTLFEKHSSTFSDWTAADGDLTSYDSDNWTKSGRLGINGNMVQIQAASGTLDDGELTYNKAADDGVFYYKYKVRMTGDKNQNTISLAGVNDAVVLVSPITDTSSTYEFTTVVDDNMAYTYDSTGNYVKAAEFTGKVTGLTFKSTSGKEIRIQEIHYGVMINPPALSDYVQVEEDKPNFSTWTADEGDNTLTSYDETNWTASGRLGVTTADSVKQAQIKAKTDSYDDGVLTYNKAADSGMFYYKYKVRMTDSNNRNTISLAGVDNAVVLVSPLATTGGTYEYTTIVCGDMAYTYDADGKFVKAAEFTGTVTGLTFKSTSGEIRIKEISFGKLKKDANISIDYKNEKLIGFVDGGDYTIGGDTVTPENNELTIADNYFGQTLEIGGMLSGVELTQSLEVPARPAAPVDGTDYTLTQPTVYGAKGSLKATAADTLEYKIDNGDWTSLPTDAVEVDQGSTVQIRKSATDSAFASEPTEQTIRTIAQTFTVTWKNGSETLETDENVVDGAAPSYDGETPAKTATADKTYTFSGWRIADGNGEATGDLITPEQLASKKITADTTYIAQFTETARKYRITFVDEDGSTVLKAATEYEYGATVVEPETPTKSATAEYTYSFADWTPSVTTVTGDQTYTATFTESAREYNITYNLNGHGTALTGNNLKYTAGTAKELPALTDDNYNFGGWYEDNTTFNTAAQITAATRGDKTFYAKWTAKTYAVSAAAELTNGSVSVNKTTASLNDEITVTITPNIGYQLASLTIGGAAVTGEALTNAARSNSYTFSMPAKAVEVTATFEEIPVNTYTVTIICGDGIENVKLGTKTGSKDGNIYTFTEVEAGEYNFEVTYTEGYEKATVSPTSITVSESKTSETISAQKKKYTVTFKIEGRDDTEVQIEHGSTAQSQAPQNPTKSGYHFVGWVKGTDTTAAIITTWDAITSNGTIYTAKFEENAPDTVTVTFNAGDGTFDNAEKTKAVTINKGATLTANNLPSVTPPTGYTFNGWGDITGKAVNESVSYTAEYTIKSFTITWMLDESAKIDETTVDYNVLPTHADASKAATDEYTYTFKNWAPTIVVATENATYTAQFDSVKRKYTITWNIDGAETSEELEYGATPSHANPTKAEDANGKYSFTGWSPAIETVTKAQTYTAQFDTIAKYTITYNTDGGQINDDNYPRKYYAGEGVALPSDVTKDNYYFTGWYDNAEFNGEPVTSITASDNGNKEYWAQWTQGTPTEYLITFVNWDNTELQKSNVAVGVTPEYTGTTPTKAEDDRYTYEFIGWTPEIVTVTGIATYKAEFKQYVKPVNNAATIEKETDTNGIRLIVTPNDSTVNVINLYAAIYNANGSLKSVEMTPCTVSDNGKIIVPLTEPSLAGGESYKLMLWDIYQSPLITAITNSDSFFN